MQSNILWSQGTINLTYIWWNEGTIGPLQIASAPQKEHTWQINCLGVHKERQGKSVIQIHLKLVNGSTLHKTVPKIGIGLTYLILHLPCQKRIFFFLYFPTNLSFPCHFFPGKINVFQYFFQYYFATIAYEKHIHGMKNLNIIKWIFFRKGMIQAND